MNMRAAAPVAIIGIIIVVIVGGTAGYLYYSSSQSHYSAGNTPTTIPQSGQSTSLYTTTVPGQSYGSQLSVQVKNVSVNTTLDQGVGYNNNGGIPYTAYDPTVTLALSANQNGYATAIVQFYNSAGFIAATGTGYVKVAQGGPQLISVTLPGVTLNAPDKYTMNLKLNASVSPYSESSNTIYQTNVSDILVGASSYPIVQSVSITPFAIHTRCYNDACNTSSSYSNLYQIYYSTNTTNTGNADILGYYKYTSYINGAPETTWYGGYGGGYPSIPICGSTYCDYILLRPSGPFKTVGQSYGDWAGSNPVQDFFCNGGAQVTMNVSFYSASATNPASPGKLLNSVVLGPFTCGLAVNNTMP